MAERPRIYFRAHGGFRSRRRLGQHGDRVGDHRDDARRDRGLRLGYLVGLLFGTERIFAAIGMVIGAVGAICIVYLRYGRERRTVAPERELIRRIAPWALPAAIVAFALGTWIGGTDAGWSAAIGIAVVFANFVAHGWSLALAATISPTVLSRSAWAGSSSDSASSW